MENWWQQRLQRFGFWRDDGLRQKNWWSGSSKTDVSGKRLMLKNSLFIFWKRKIFSQSKLGNWRNQSRQLLILKEE
jgi:hypothetical protein